MPRKSRGKGLGRGNHAPRKIPLLDELPPREAIFIIEYLKDFNGTQAVIRTGFGVKRPDVKAAELLGKSRIRAAIDQAKEEGIAWLKQEADETRRE
jgi:phage terminase small subunit